MPVGKTKSTHVRAERPLKEYAALGYDQLAIRAFYITDCLFSAAALILAGVILGSVTVLIIERKLTHAVAFALGARSLLSLD